MAKQSLTAKRSIYLALAAAAVIGLLGWLMTSIVYFLIFPVTSLLLALAVRTTGTNRP